MWRAVLHRQQSRGALKKLNLGSCVAEGEVDVVRACGIRRAGFPGDGLFTRALQVGLWQSCCRLPLWGGRGEVAHQQQTDWSRNKPTEWEHD